jgi:hypothetical protein
MKVLGILGLAILVFASCEDNTTVTETTAVVQDSIVLAQKVKASKTIQVTLQSEPKEFVANWLAYITAQDEIANLETASLQNVVEKAVPLSKIMTELRSTIPEQLSSKAVMSRLIVIETKTKILEQLTKRQTLDSEKVLVIAKELPQDFENFKLQLNELFLKTPDQFEIELDDRLDSIQKANEENSQLQLEPRELEPNEFKVLGSDN